MGSHKFNFWKADVGPLSELLNSSLQYWHATWTVVVCQPVFTRT